MESLDPFEAGGADRPPSTIGWLSPRVSFSKDFVVLDRVSPEKFRREQQTPHDGSVFEFEFCSSVGADVASMLAADELFFDGKVRFDRALQDESNSRTGKEQMHSIEREEGLRDDHHLRSFCENPRCSSMIFEGTRELPLRSCISFNNSRYPCNSRSFGLRPTASLSPEASSSKNTKFKEFLKVHLPRIRQLPSSELSRESSASFGRRTPVSARSFWRFPRSNSASETKTSLAVSPPPRRNSSAGENKTPSSCLRNSPGYVASEAKASKPRPPQPSQATKGLPTSTVKKSSGNHAFLMPLNFSSHAVAVSSQSASLSNPVFSNSSSVSIHEPSITKGVHNSASARSIDRQTDSVAPSNSSEGTMLDVSFNTSRFTSCRSPERPAKRGIRIPSRNFAISPGRSNARNGLGRGGATSKGLERPPDILTREACKGPRQFAHNPSVRVMPVLNVPVCMGPSFRGSKTSSKSKIFNLGSFFPKREKAAFGDSLLPLDSQSGA